MLRRSLPYACLAMFWLAMLFSRWFWPYDETRYLSVAWEMWQRGDFLVPYLNGAPYSHKPPLLFWLIHLGWWCFGVNDLWPRLLPLWFSFLGLAATSALAKKLWPEDTTGRRLALWVLGASLLWAVYTPMLYFDLAVAACAAWAIWAGFVAREGKGWGFLLCAFFLALGVLAKGPMVGLVAGPVLLALSVWGKENRLAFLRKMILCGVFALAVGALWAIPAAIAGGEAYAWDILWRQMAGRAVDAFAHARPFWWYAALLPALLAPWIVLPALWRALARVRLDPALGICLLWALLPFAVFSIFSGKQPHYLLPLFPPVALLFGRAISAQAEAPIAWPTRVLPAAVFFLGGVVFGVGALLSWLNHIRAPVSLYPNMLLPAVAALGLSRPLFRLKNFSRQVEYLGMATFVFLTALTLGVVSSINGRFDLRPLAAEIRQLEANRPLAFVGKYAGEFHYAARLQKPFAIIRKADVLPWLLQNENGIVIARDKEVNSILPLVCQPYRSNRMCLFEAPTLKQHLVWRDKPKG